MSLPRVSPWHVLYLSGMTNPGAVEFPDRPVAWAGKDSRPVLIRHGVAAPSTVHAAVKLAEFGFAVTLDIRVDVGGTVRVAELGIHARETPAVGAITSRSLRSIRLDQIAREAVRQLEYRVSMREDITPGAFERAGDDPKTVWVPGSRVRLPRRTPHEQATEAARIYREAVDSGSRAPTQAVADQLGYSRSQVSRMIRTARDLGLLDDTSNTRQPNDGKRTDASNQDD